MEPKVTDRVDAVSKAGASKLTREVNNERLKDFKKKKMCMKWNTAQNEPIMILMLWLLESMLSKPNINIIILFQKKSIHTLENKVLMHQCAIAQRISTYTLNFEI